MHMVKASELREGDVIRIGKSENYILAAEIIREGRQVSVWAYDGPNKAQYGPSLRFKGGDDVQVSVRDMLPGKRGTGR
jgi:translation elongation factor P/translation initiation factor 5A